MVLEKLNQAEIIDLLGSIYEHSPWVAEILFSQGITSQDNDVGFLAERMKRIVDTSSEEMKLNLLQAHPELAGKLAISGNLTKDSTAEQASAGLDQCSKEEFAEFSKLNLEYTKNLATPL